jgi:ABC-type lipoprotein release transport system permease subunit
MQGILLLAKIGWRNLWRNPRGTLLTALALGLGLTLLLVSLGLLDGGHEQMVANGVRFGAGHVVIQAKGYQDSGSQELSLPSGVVSATREFLQSDAMNRAVAGVSPRLLASGLLTSSVNADGVRVMGVVPKDERAVSLIPQRMVQGTYLADDQKTGVVLGVDLARKLGVKIGAKLVLMTQAVPQAAAASTDGGEMQSTLLRVTGIFRTGIQAIDSHVVQVPLPEVQTLLGAPDGVNQIAVLLEREGDSLVVAQGLRKALAGAPVEILPWREAMPTLAQLFVLDDAFNYVMNGVVLAMVGLGILNTVLMRVLQRRFEFGLCSALGLRPMQLGLMIVGESLALTSISLAFGLVLGLSLQHFFATHGLDLRWFFKSSPPPALVFDPIIYARLSPMRIVSSIVIVFLTATIISIYPALKAARTKLPNALKVF